MRKHVKMITKNLFKKPFWDLAQSKVNRWKLASKYMPYNWKKGCFSVSVRMKSLHYLLLNELGSVFKGGNSYWLSFSDSAFKSPLPPLLLRFVESSRNPTTSKGHRSGRNQSHLRPVLKKKDPTAFVMVDKVSRNVYSRRKWQVTSDHPTSTNCPMPRKTRPLEGLGVTGTVYD